MKEGTINDRDMQSVQNDYLREVVPDSARTSAVSVLFVFLGFIIVVGIMAVGGGLAANMEFEDIAFATLIGNLILGSVAAFAGFTGARSGLSFNRMLEGTFPRSSYYLASLYVPIILIGWYAVEAGIFGHFAASLLELTGFGESILIFGSGLAFAVSAYFGFRWLRYLSFVLVPIMIGLGMLAIVLAAGEGNASYAFGEIDLGMWEAVGIVSGTWIMGAVTVVPDLTRFCKSTLAGAMVGFVGILFGNSFTILLGTAGAGLTQQADPALILITLGMPIVAFMFGVANIWTTNDNNMYSASLHAAGVLSISRRKAVLVCAVLGAAIALFDLYEVQKLFTFLGFLGNTAPALGAVVFGHYWVTSDDSRPALSPLPGWIGWIVGSTAAWFAPPVMNLFIGAGVSFLLFIGATHLVRKHSMK